LPRAHTVRLHIAAIAAAAVSEDRDMEWTILKLRRENEKSAVRISVFI
jgi:hypothetical protein